MYINYYFLSEIDTEVIIYYVEIQYIYIICNIYHKIHIKIHLIIQEY